MTRANSVDPDQLAHLIRIYTVCSWDKVCIYRGKDKILFTWLESIYGFLQLRLKIVVCCGINLMITLNRASGQSTYDIYQNILIV
jgi:hypothetical protein